MSALDDIGSNAAAAHGSLDEAQTLVKHASEEASELAQSAAGHGWAGIAQVMSSAQETLEEAAGVIDNAMTATSEGLTHLSEITAEMSSDEVAGRLNEIGQRFEKARSAASQAIESLGDAQSSAKQANAERLAQLVDGAWESLTTGRESLASAVTSTESEQSEATAWGTGRGSPQPRRAAADPTADPSPNLRRPGNDKGPLGDRFRPGVHDEDCHFSDKELAIADWLVSTNPAACIHPRQRDPALDETSPDAMVRTTPDDWGTVTEFKTLDGPTSRAVKDNIRAGIRQVLPHGNGHVVVDGRPLALTEANARQGYARLVGERKSHGRPMAQQVTIILGDGRGLSWRNDD
jgi:hypothetical protein